MIIIGHRGARGLAPENTLASLRKAIEYEVDWIEIDARVTDQSIPVLCHGSKIGDDSTTLGECLSEINGKIPLLIEVKPRVDIQPIVQLLKGYHYEFLLGSKSQKTLLQLHSAMPKVPKIVIEPWSGIRAAYRARQLNTKFIEMNQLFLWFGFIANMKKRGYKLYAYTLNHPEKAKKWAKHGLAGIVTDYPDRFTKP